MLSDVLGIIYTPPEVARECVSNEVKQDSYLIQNSIDNGIIIVSNQGVNHEFLKRIPPGVDYGEAQAISLALTMKSKLLIDDKIGRKIAKKEKIPVIGFGAVLVRLKQLNLIDSVYIVIQRMQVLNYRLSDRVLDEILRLCGENNNS